jgi:hypothetical protein
MKRRGRPFVPFPARRIFVSFVPFVLEPFRRRAYCNTFRSASARECDQASGVCSQGVVPV